MCDHKRFDNDDYWDDVRRAKEDRRILPHPMSPAFDTTQPDDCVPVIEDMVQGMILVSLSTSSEGASPSRSHRAGPSFDLKG